MTIKKVAKYQKNDIFTKKTERLSFTKGVKVKTPNGHSGICTSDGTLQIVDYVTQQQAASTIPQFTFFFK